ncbi:MAG: DUF2442 domain-containing protein [Ignavibacteriae bacterium]|nr:DUF2442 domain-containing protein [Ignavibacteriota bacterium]
MININKVRPLEHYQLELEFSDGMTGVIDVSSYVGSGVFSAWLDKNFFNNVQIGESSELKWGDDIDLCPDALYMKLTGKSVEEVFPTIDVELDYA